MYTGILRNLSDVGNRSSVILCPLKCGPILTAATLVSEYAPTCLEPFRTIWGVERWHHSCTATEWPAALLLLLLRLCIPSSEDDLLNYGCIFECHQI